MRIAALLLALASLAERACRAPFPVRLLVLFILRPAESVARDFVGDEFFSNPAPAGEGFDPAAALCLAESFVALAAVLAGLAHWLDASCRVRIGISAAICRAPVAAYFPGRRTLPFDTS